MRHVSRLLQLALLVALLFGLGALGARPARATAPAGLRLIELPSGEVAPFAIDAKADSAVKYYSGRAGLERVVAQSLGGIPADQVEAARPRIREALRAAAAPGSFWLDEGFAGVEFRGKGMARTRIRRGSSDSTVLVDRHSGTVRFADLALVPSSRHGIFFGLKHRDEPVDPRFRLELERVWIVTAAPASGSGHSTVWPLFGYQADVSLVDVRGDGRYGAEHFFYWRGFAREGATFRRVAITASGAQGIKFRNSVEECAWVPGARIVVADCSIAGWYQPHTWRGGGGIVGEGLGCDLVVERTVFYNPGGLEGGAFDDVPASSRTRAIMVDDAQGDFYSALDGTPGQGFAAGHVLVRNCGFYVGPGAENLSPVIRVGGLGTGASSRFVARSVTIEGCGIFGERLQLQFSNVPAGRLKVRGNNTPALTAYATAYRSDLDRDGDLEAFDTSHEALLPLSDKVVPVSTGLVR